MAAQEKDVVVLSAVVGEDRKLVIELPPDAPTGPVELIVRSTKAVEQQPYYNPAREAARAKLLAAGVLSTAHHAPEGAVPLTVEERMRIGTLPPGARPSEDLVNEDRGEY
ncbi:MAG: hypothetical protein HZC41_09790 [Chloroflexi bacterium]|nr:hypothetical protein [Chloroflexota bacterium]